MQCVPRKVSDQLFVPLYTLSIYPCVHKQLIRTLFEAHIVSIYQSIFHLPNPFPLFNKLNLGIQFQSRAILDCV